MMPLTGDRCQCSVCKKYFNSTKAFDKHRTGEHGGDRRCLSTEEMEERGMVLNARGYWITEAYKQYH